MVSDLLSDVTAFISGWEIEYGIRDQGDFNLISVEAYMKYFSLYI